MDKLNGSAPVKVMSKRYRSAGKIAAPVLPPIVKPKVALAHLDRYDEHKKVIVHS